MRGCVLLITDNFIALREAQAGLRGAGYLVVASSDVVLALNLLKCTTYDAVVADVDALKRADGEARVSRNVTALLNSTSHARVILACSGGDRGGSNGSDSMGFVKLDNTRALLRYVKQVVGPQGRQDDLSSPRHNTYEDSGDYSCNEGSQAQSTGVGVSE
jgi:hypothetical protein